MPKTIVSLSDRLLTKVVCDVATKCWNFTGHRNRDGYGMLAIGHRATDRTHRIAYQLFTGPIPQGHEIHHVCENRGCCNPAHLVAVVRKQHLKMTPRWAGNRTHCPQGHEYTPDNIVQAALRNRGVRQCRACALVASANYDRKNADRIRARRKAQKERDRAADPIGFRARQRQYEQTYRAKKLASQGS